MNELPQADRFAPLTAQERSKKSRKAPGQAAAEIEIIMPVPLGVPEPSFVHLSHGQPTTVWTYRNAGGAVLFYSCRFDKSDGGKEFAPLSWGRRLSNDKHEWLWKMPISKRPLYGLDKLAANPSATVIICEGEKATDAAARVFPEAVAMCWPGGSNAVDKADFAPLAGHTVMLWPDNDEPGVKCMTKVAGILSDLGCDVSMIDPAKAAAMVTDDAVAHREPPAKWDAADAVAEWSDLGALRKAMLALAERREPPPKYRSFGDFEMTPDGLTVGVTKKRGDKSEAVQVLVSAAFEVIGRVRSPAGDGWAKLIRWRDEDSRVHSFAVSDGALHGDLRTFIADLASKGLKIERGTGPHLADYLNRVHVDNRVTTVDRTGWHEVGDKLVFVLPAETIGSASDESVILSGSSAAPFEAKGSLSDWQTGVGALVAGHSRHVFAVAASFAGPLLALVKHDGGGFNLHGGSSTGKSTAIEAAASVWGRGSSPGFVRSWRSTANAIEAAAALHTDTALILDELGVVDAKEAGAAAYQLAAGSGRGRSGRDGYLRASMTWRTLILSTGEIRLADKLAEGKQRATAGQAVRLVDIPADAGKGFGSFDCAGTTGNAKAIADAIKRAAKSAYGTAGPEFVRRLIAEGTDENARLALGMIDTFREKMVPANADGQIQRAADRFGLVAAAGEIAIALGVVPWPKGEAKRAVETCFAAWLDARGGSEPFEVREAIGRVRAFIEAHGESRFEALPKDSSRTVSNRVGYQKGDGDTRQWLVFPEAWRNEVLPGHDPKATAGWLAERGMLKRGKDGLQVVHKVDGKPCRFYLITAEILAGGIADEPEEPEPM